MPHRRTAAAALVLFALAIPNRTRAEGPAIPDAIEAKPTAGAHTTASVGGPTSEAPIVDLVADDPRATLERRASAVSPTVPIVETGIVSMGAWEHICAMPCGTRLDPRYTYRIAGDGLVPSGSFALPRGHDRVRVDAQMGSSTGRVIGLAATAGGVLAMLGGGLALAATPILESEDVGSKDLRMGVLAGGIGALSMGALSTALGLFLWFNNGSKARAEPVMAAPSTP